MEHRVIKVNMWEHCCLLFFFLSDFYKAATPIFLGTSGQKLRWTTELGYKPYSSLWPCERCVTSHKHSTASWITFTFNVIQIYMYIYVSFLIINTLHTSVWYIHCTIKNIFNPGYKSQVTVILSLCLTLSLSHPLCLRASLYRHHFLSAPPYRRLTVSLSHPHPVSLFLSLCCWFKQRWLGIGSHCHLS